MTDRFYPNFTDTLEWNLVARESYTAPSETRDGNTYYLPIPLKSWMISDSYLLMIGVESAGTKSSWYTGGWASQRLLFLPSTTSTFLATVETRSKRLRKSALTLFEAEKFMSPWLLAIQFPRWFTNASVEIWRYDGTDLDVFQRIDQLEGLINAP